MTMVPRRETGAVNNTVVATPGGPTGIVWNGTAGAFPIPGGQSSFIADTEGPGTILGWRSGTAAVLGFTHAGAIYKGLAIATAAAGPQLYAANFRNGRCSVFSRRHPLQVSAVVDTQASRGLRAPRALLHETNWSAPMTLTDAQVGDCPGGARKPSCTDNRCRHLRGASSVAAACASLTAGPGGIWSSPWGVV